MSDLQVRILELYGSEKSTEEIARELSTCKSYVLTTWKQAGLKKRPTALQRRVRSLREQGKCCSEIADTLGILRKNVKRVANDIGLPFSEDEVKRSIEIGRAKALKNQYGYSSESDRACFEIDYIKENYPEWSYVGGFHNSDGSMELRCNCCGTIIKRSAVSVRHGKIRCDVCFGEKLKAQKIQRETEKETNRRIRLQKQSETYWKKFLEKEYKLPTIKKCEICDILFVSRKPGQKYCSPDCARKATNRRNDKRIRRILKKDRSINLEKLYKRDNGICWICGGKCDYDDYHFDENKHFVVGNNYPSIDHVFPLSKGGNHTWENVRLAHHYCNTLKSDKVVIK